MDWFLSDLDNTLIYSYKKALGADKHLVETKDGKELSFMSSRSYELLKLIRKCCCFVPVTTRSLAQYRRIFLFSGEAENLPVSQGNTTEEAPPYALTANGGILLRKGIPDDSWYEESKAICAHAEPMLKEAERILALDPSVSFEIKRVDGLFVFTKSDRQEATVDKLRQVLNLQTVDVRSNGSKIYVIPKGLNKGDAVQRFKILTGANQILAAGDSQFDLSMLLEADEAWLPESLHRTLDISTVSSVRNSKKLHVICENELFSDALLLALMKRQLPEVDLERKLMY